MSKKVFNVFSILCFALVLCFIGCTELINPKTVTDINLNIDLSKIIKSTRNTEEIQSSVSIGENPTIKVAIYDAKKYNATTNSTDNLDLITEAQAQIENNGAKVKLNNIPVGIDAIVFAELSFSNENSTEVMYAGNSEVFRVEPTDNKISLVLKKVGNSEIYPGDTNTPYERFTLFQKNSDGTEVTNVTGASIETSSTAATKVTVTNPQSSDSVWTYFVKPENKSKFIEDANYKVSVELKTKSDATTVVGIAAARADYLFTVNSDWTPCEFETGYVKGSTDHDFTIGLGLSSEIEIRNLKIEKLKTTDTIEPSLVFDISKYAINSYLENNNRPGKIIEVSKDATNGSYDITINTPMCHSTGNSTDTDDSYIQDVKLHLRSYATETTGANNVSFNITNNGGNDFETSVMADTANDKSTAWNNNATKISENSNFSVDFPNYKANDELTVGLITSSTSINNSTSFKLSNFKVENAGDSPFSDKIFAIQVGNNWIQSGSGASFSTEVTINESASINFDVGLFNGFNNVNWTPSDFDDVTRFLYKGKNLPAGLSYREEAGPKFIIANNSDSDKMVKISLNEKYEVVIEEFTSTSGGGTSLNEISSWDDLVAKINSLSDDTTITEFKIMNNLTATSKIDLLYPVKITSDKAVTITRGDSFKDAFFETAVGLEIIGTQTAKITFDGESTSATQPIIYASSDLSLEYCNFINNTNTQTDGGALHINSTSENTINININISNCNFTNNSVTGSLMAGGAVAIISTTAISNFKNCTFENNIAMQHGGGAIYISGNTKNCSEKWTTFEDCTFKNNESYYSDYDYGGAIYVTSGPVSLNTVHMENNFIFQGDTDTTGTSSDIYLNGYQQELKLNGRITISTLKIKINTNTPKDIGISDLFNTVISEIENLILAVDTGSVSNVSQPFKIYTYDTVGTNAYSETECTLTNNQINCFNSIYDEQSIYYQLLEDGSIEQKQ